MNQSTAFLFVSLLANTLGLASAAVGADLPIIALLSCIGLASLGVSCYYLVQDK